MDTIPQDAPQDKPTPKFTYIYVLVDPETQAIRYVGKADNPRKRLTGHIRGYRDSNKHKLNWIRGLASRGLYPIMQVIEQVPYEMWPERECYWMQFYRSQGCALLNIADGGKGGSFLHTKEHKRKIGDFFRGKPQTPEHVEKRAAKHRGMKRSPESVERSASKHRGKKLARDGVEKRAATQRGMKRKPFSEEHRRKLSEAAKRREPNPEANAKRSATQKGRKQSPEWIAKRTAARRGKKMSLEARANISLGRKRASAMKRNPPDGPILWG